MNIDNTNSLQLIFLVGIHLILGACGSATDLKDRAEGLADENPNFVLDEAYSLSTEGAQSVSQDFDFSTASCEEIEAELQARHEAHKAQEGSAETEKPTVMERAEEKTTKLISAMGKEGPYFREDLLAAITTMITERDAHKEKLKSCFPERSGKGKRKHHHRGL